MLINSTLGSCRACHKPLRGRTDKKFCGDYCRSAFNNQLKAATNNVMRNINNALRKNRKILEILSSAGTITISRDVLLKMGFQFKYFTYTDDSLQGITYYFCYEYGYTVLENSTYLIVKQKEE